MKKLSDYRDDEAIELWADLLEPLSAILSDSNMAQIVKTGKNKVLIAKTILKAHASEAKEILLRIDPTPLDGFNIILRLVEILTEIGENETVKSFFGYAEQAQMGNVSSGSPTESTEGAEN